MTLRLDRAALEDGGAEPQRLAAAILVQMGYRGGRVPIDDIALALDIVEIRKEPLTNLEGVLLTTADRNVGSILINNKSSRQRGRFTLGHELGHFLNPYHVGTDGSGHSCSSGDMRAAGPSADNRHRQQEAEANRFAIEILVPRIGCQKYFQGDPDMAEILAMAAEFDISRESAARRYIELHGDAVAIVFSKNNRLTYAVRSDAFPSMAVRREDLLPLGQPVSGAERSIPIEETDTSFWLTRKGGEGELTLQTLFQKDDHAMSLLHLTTPDEEAEPDLEDTCDRFARFNDR